MNDGDLMTYPALYLIYQMPAVSHLSEQVLRQYIGIFVYRVV